VNGTALLRLADVSKTFGGVMAVRELNLEVCRGRICGLIGPNGAGKTTVFNLITGVYPCTEGCISFLDTELTRLKPHTITRLGVARTFQTIRLFASLSTREHVMVGQNSLMGKSASGEAARNGVRQKNLREEAEEILHLLGLWDVRGRRASTLPYGTQRKVEIARALATRPRLLLLDEPAAGLNMQETRDLLKTLATINERGTSILIIEHDMRVIMGICHHIFVLNFGQKIAEGAPEEIRANEQVIEAYLGKEE
jgi:branched-chain amino acid transport system ATP-binding protein